MGRIKKKKRSRKKKVNARRPSDMIINWSHGVQTIGRATRPTRGLQGGFSSQTVSRNYVWCPRNFGIPPGSLSARRNGRVAARESCSWIDGGNNAGFKPVEFDGLRKLAGFCSFAWTPKKWSDRSQSFALQLKPSVTLTRQVCDRRIKSGDLNSRFNKYMTIISTSETAIFERIVLPAEPDPGRQAAQSILALDFDAEDRQRMQQLADRAKQGNLTPDEERQLDNYERVGHYLAILQSKARLALRPDAGGKS